MNNKLFISIILLMLASKTGSSFSPAEDLSSNPIEPDLAVRLKENLQKTETDNMKLSMEITRRIDYYFYVLEKTDALGRVYRSSLLPMIYQRDLFQGNTAKNTPALIRSPLVAGIENLFIRMLQPFYALAILATGLYLLLVSGSPSGRANAKATLVKLVLGLGLITLTLPIMETLLETSHYIASALIAAPGIEYIGGRVSADMFMDVAAYFTRLFLTITYFDTNMGLPFLAAVAGPPLAVLMILCIRYYLIILFTILFPFSVLLYSFIGTRRIGRILLAQTLLWIFMPVIEAVVLLACWTAYESVPYISGLPTQSVTDMRVYTALAGFLALALAPLFAAGAVNWMVTQSRSSATYVITTEKSDEDNEADNEVKEDPEYEEVREGVLS